MHTYPTTHLTLTPRLTPRPSPPFHSGKLIEAAVAKDRKYGERARLPRGAKHLVVTGSFSYQSLSDFLAEVFHDDHGQSVATNFNY